MSEKDITEINLIYNIRGKSNIRIFGPKFVKNNKNKCKMIVYNRENEITSEFNVKFK